MKRLLTGSHRIFFLPVTTIISNKSDTYNTWQIIHSNCSYKDRKTGNKTILEYIKTKSPVNLESTIHMLENDYPKVVRDNLMNFLTNCINYNLLVHKSFYIYY